MRWVAGLLLSLGVAHAAVTAAGLGREIREISLDPGECYRVRELALSKDEVRLYFTDGYLMFAKPVAGARTAAVFTANVEGGDGEVLALLPNRGERRSLASYIGSPNLDEHITAAVMLFSDDSYAKLSEQIARNPYNRKAPEMGAIMADQWNPVLRNIGSSFQTRLVLDLLAGEPQSRGFFGASLSGRNLGNFDLYYDRSAPEQIVMGKLNTRDNQVFFDVWTSFVSRSFRNHPVEPEMRLEDFRIEATLEPDLSLSGVTRVRVTPTRAPLRVLAFDLARQMTVSAARVDGRAAEVFERESMRSALIRNVGNEMFLVAPPEPLQPGKAYEVEIRHAGKVIADAGNQVYYVAARANWFPNYGLQFATFDLTFRYPKGLDLVTPGDLVEDRVDGDWRITRRKTGAPVLMAGFNLGRFERVRTARHGYTVEVCANLAPEPELAARAGPSPFEAGRLQELAGEVASAVDFMAMRFGPPALRTLTVAPIPGTFGQGFPGLIYLSTMSYLAPKEKAMSALDRRTRYFFSQILLAHETAHQWWGNVVTSAGYHDEWLMEALADYSALLYLEGRDGPGASAGVLERYKAEMLGKTPGGGTVESAGPIVLGRRLDSSQAPDAYRVITYGKGSWIMHMLRRRIGDQRFLEMLAGLRKEYERKPLSTDEFRAVAARFLPPKSSDADLETFFDQWVYGTGIPALKLSYSVKGKAPAVRLSGTITQSDVDEGFSVPVPVEIQLPRGKSVTHWVHTANGAVPFTVKLPQAPVKVLLDPGDSVLRR